MPDGGTLVGLAALATVLQIGATAVFGNRTLDAPSRILAARAVLVGVGLIISYSLFALILSTVYATGPPIDLTILAVSVGFGLLSYRGATAGQHLGRSSELGDSPADIFARTGGVVFVALSVVVYVL